MFEIFHDKFGKLYQRYCRHSSYSSREPTRSWKVTKKNWEILTKDRWILETVQGYSIEFIAEPHQDMKAHPPHNPQDETLSILEEVSYLLQKGTLGPVEQTETQEGFYSNVFLVP